MRKFLTFFVAALFSMAMFADATYYLKNAWNGGDWTWKEMTKDGDNYKLEKAVFGGGGVNFNTAQSDEGSTWVAVADFLGDKTVDALDTVTFVLDPIEGKITATLVGKYAGSGKYYLKNNWNGGEWTWKEMTKDGDNYKLEKAVFGGTGVNYNNASVGDGTWVPVADFLGDKTVGSLDTVTFVLDPAAGKITATLVGKYAASADTKYYLVGTINEWNTETIDDKYLFSVNPDNDKEYKLEVTLAVNDGIKVIGKSGSTVTWYPEGMDNEYKVDAKHAGDKTIYFQTTYKEDWSAFGGYIWIDENKDPDPQPTTGFYITGDSALVVDAGLTADKKWNSDAIKSEKDTFILNLKKDVDYLLKVTLDGTWDDGKVKGYSDLTDKTNMVAGKDNNIGFKLKEAGEVKVIFNATEFKLVGNFAEVEAPTIEDGYYLIGPDWTIADLGEKFVENPDKDGEWQVEVTLAVDQEIKVVEVKDNAIKTWFPDGMDNAYKVDAKHAGKKTIYFNPTEQSEWLAGGFIWIDENTEPQPQPSDGFYVTGDEAFIVAIGLDKEKAWAPDAMKSEKDTLALNIAAGDYVMKVTLDGKWETAKGFSDLTEKAKGLMADKDNNILFSLTEAGVVKVIYFVKDEVVTFKLEGKFDESKVPDIADGYYLNGSHADWEVAKLKNYAFTVNPDNAEEYQLTTTLTVGQKIKPVLVESGAVKTWFPETGGDYEVDAAHAGEKVVYFRPVVNAEWTMCGGHIFIAENEQSIDNTAVEAKVVKFFENGQLIIIKNGVKYNAQGAVVR